MILRSYLKTLTLLCVEKDDLTNSIYEGLFTIIFKKIIFASNTKDALDAYSKQKIDIIITSSQDFRNISGLNMIKEIRNDNTDIPIILVSSFDNVELLLEALRLRVTNFLKKPFETTELLEAIEKAAKELLASNYLEDEHKKSISLLEDKVNYSNYQEDLSFKKALKVIRNDFYYKSLKQNDTSITIIDFLYSAFDTISGDTYSARRIDENRTLFFIIDGMGKGLAASISSIIECISLNRLIDDLLEYNKYITLNKVIEKIIKHTSKSLLDEEILSASLVMLDDERKTLEHASFSMPPLLLEDKNGNISKVKSNNPPITPYTKGFKTDEISFKDIRKILIYSDGLAENSLKDENETYYKYINEDFLNSSTREDFRKKFNSRIGEQEDDVTFILIHYIPLKKSTYSLTIDTTLSQTQEANEWFEKILSKQSSDETIKSNASLAFMELLMNAYEHGNLGLQAKQKHKLMADDKYFEFLAREELVCKKKIYIKVYRYQNSLVVQIQDEGDGFDTKILSQIFGFNKNFCSRGILMSRNATAGIYYNKTANMISFIINLD